MRSAESEGERDEREVSGREAEIPDTQVSTAAKAAEPQGKTLTGNCEGVRMD